MLGYIKEDLDNMINAVHDSKLFYLNNNGPDSDMQEKLYQVNDFLQGLWAEGYFD